MPDISLLQREYYGPEEEESRLPGFVSTAALVALIISIAAYVGLFLYQQVLESRVESIAENIQNLNAQNEDTAKTTLEIKKAGAQARNLAALREAHAYPTKVFSYLERSTHPALRFLDAAFDMTALTVKANALIDTPAQLVRQVELYEKDVQEKRLSDFTADGLGYGEGKAVQFAVQLTLPKQ